MFWDMQIKQLYMNMHFEYDIHKSWVDNKLHFI